MKAPHDRVPARAGDGEPVDAQSYASAILNILDDAAREKSQLVDTQRAALNILEDLDVEKKKAEQINVDLRNEIAVRARAEEALRHANEVTEAANQAKDRFLASMSHELRTPLNAIIGFTGTLLMRLPGPLTADQEKQLKTIQSSGKHLLSLINDILDLAKIESGKVKLDIGPVVCNAVVEEIAVTLAPLAEVKGLKFEVRAGGEQIAVRTDRRALTQILLNLANNAVKFTEHGRVTVSLSRKSGCALFAVADTGVGMTADDQKKLFLAFSQVDSSSTRRFEGTGLGLHLSRKLAEMIGGTIAVASEPGTGSVFTLQIPSL